MNIKRLAFRAVLFAATIGLMLVNLIPAVPVGVLAFTYPVAQTVAYVVGASGLLVLLTGHFVRKAALLSPFSDSADSLIRVAGKARGLPTTRHYAYVLLAVLYVILLSAADFLLPLAAVATGIVLAYIDQGLAQRDAQIVARHRLGASHTSMRGATMARPGR
jgi:hypothetical protein